MSNKDREAKIRDGEIHDVALDDHGVSVPSCSQELILLLTVLEFHEDVFCCCRCGCWCSWGCGCGQVDDEVQSVCVALSGLSLSLSSSHVSPSASSARLRVPSTLPSSRACSAALLAARQTRRRHRAVRMCGPPSTTDPPCVLPPCHVSIRHITLHLH